MGRSTSLPNVSAGWEDASLAYRTRPQVCRATIDGKHAADFADKGVDVMVKRKSRATCSERRIIGWREWVSLPALGIDAIKAKLDTGAKTSALHAWDQEIYEQDDRPWVRFSAHPFQRNDAIVVRCSAPLADYRWVRNSGGARDRRYVIATELAVGDATWSIELTLTKRDEMGFRMLIGREAMGGRLIVDPRQSYRAGRRAAFVASLRHTPKRRTVPRSAE